MMKLLILVSMLMAGPVGAGDTVPAVTIAELQGLWRMAYDAPSRGVDEPSQGYLVIMPNGQYYEIRNDCCEGPNLMRSPSTFRIVGNKVIFSGRRRNGSNAGIEHTRTFHRNARVTFYDDEKKGFTRPTTTFALTVGEKREFGYSWAKIYPRWNEAATVDGK